MPILIVSNAPDALPAAAIARLANEAEAVVAIDGGGHRCLAAGVTPVLVIGDLDSLDADAVATLREQGVEFSVHPVLKDRSDLDIALEEVADRWDDPVIITGALGGRLDHTLASLGVLSSSHGMAIDIMEQSVDGWVLDAQGRNSVQIEGDGSLFSVFSLGGGSVTIEGAYWPLEDHLLEPLSSLGLSNRVEGPSARVLATKGRIIVLRPKLAQ